MGLVFFLGFGEGSLERMPDAESQWPTLKSGPLARAQRPEKGRKSGEVPEPVVHFGEWTTSRSEAPPRFEGLTSSGLPFYTDKVTNQPT